MAVYSEEADYTDEMLSVSDSHMERADAFVEGVLRQKGIDPAEVSLPNPDLTALAVFYASHLAAVENAAGEDPVLESKAKHYMDLYKDKRDQIDRQVLGIESGPDPYSAITIGRG